MTQTYVKGLSEYLDGFRAAQTKSIKTQSDAGYLDFPLPKSGKERTDFAKGDSVVTTESAILKAGMMGIVVDVWMDNGYAKYLVKFNPKCTAAMRQMDIKAA